MTITVIDTLWSSTFNFTSTGDTLVVLAGGSVAPSSGFAVKTSVGDANLTIEGTVAGTVGFYDASGHGNDIINLGESGALVGTQGAAMIGGNGCYVANAGLIQSVEDIAIESGAQNIIDNEGHIDGFYYAIADGGGDHINNSGTLYASFNQDSTVYESAGGNTISNSGLIGSNGDQDGLYLSGGQNSVENTGTIDGSNIGVNFAASASYLSNSGTLSGLKYAIQVNGAAGGTTIKNSGLIEVMSANGVAIDFADTGASDALTNSGTVRGSVTFAGGSATVANSGEIDGNVVFAGNGDTYNGVAGVVDGVVYCAGSTGVYIGGARGTTFSISATDLSATDLIAGGGSANDTLDITGKGTILAHSLKNVTGFETLSLGASESIFIRESVADTAAGHALTIRTSGADTVNLASVTSATDAVTVWGAAGDIITAGPSLDTFAFASAGASTGSSFDWIAGVNFAHDKFDVTTNIDAVTGINATVTTGSLSTATFNTNLAADLGASKLGADHAVLFKASSGTLAGDTFLVVDLNGAAGYQANSDLVIRLTGSTGTLSMANFV